MRRVYWLSREKEANAVWDEDLSGVYACSTRRGCSSEEGTTDGCILEARVAERVARVLDIFPMAGGWCR